VQKFTFEGIIVFFEYYGVWGHPTSLILLNDRNYFLFGLEEEGNRCDLD
jgi:hypothetical protein